MDYDEKVVLQSQALREEEMPIGVSYILSPSPSHAS